MGRLRLLNGVVLKPDGEQVTFPIPLVQLIQLNGVVVVRGEGEGRYYSGNIWGLSPEGEVLWRITEKLPLDSEFTELHVQDGKLVAFNFNGYRCIIDPQTGNLEEYVFTK